MAHHNHLRHHHNEKRREGGFEGLNGIQSEANDLLTRNAQPRVQVPDVATLVSVVYVTAAPTFDGPIGGYTTLGQPSDTAVQQSQAAQPQFTQAQSPSQQQAQSQAPSASDTRQAVQPSPNQQLTSVASSSYVAPTSSSVALSSAAVSSSILVGSSSPSTLLPSTTLSQPVYSPVLAPAASSSGTVQSTPLADQTVSKGMSSGGKAGLAIGIIIAVALVAGLALFFYARKKKQNGEYEKADDEKTSFGTASAAMAGASAAMAGARAPSTRSSVRTAKTLSTAPRLSLRPVTQFIPDLAAKRRSAGNQLAMAGAPAGMAAAGAQRNLTRPQTGGSPWERRAVPNRNNPANPNQANPFNDPVNPSVNPFGNHAEAPPPSMKMTPPDQAQVPEPLRIRTPTPEAGAGAGTDAGVAGGAAAGFAAGVAAGAAAGAMSRRNEAPKPLDLNNHDRNASPTAIAKDGALPSPSKSDASADSVADSTGTAAAIAASSGLGPNIVYRVQLDFKPSMDDELELRAGQLVRLLHEYDDGWALCIRLDRSQQGVAPRTCLSARPVKPRPAGGPRGPPPNGNAHGPRGPPLRPFGPDGRPTSPAGGRPMSPADGRSTSPAGGRGTPRLMSPEPRPMSPNTAAGFSNPPPRPQQGRPVSPANGRPMSPAGGPGPRAMSPGIYNRAPRPLSPGPMPRPQQGKRSMSPGPYGAGGMQKPMTPVSQRRRSNSAGALGVRERRNSPPGPSPLRGAGPAPGPQMRGPPRLWPPQQQGQQPRKPVPGQAM